MTMLEMRRAGSGQGRLVRDVEDDILERYILVAMREIMDLKRAYVDPTPLSPVSSNDNRDQVDGRIPLDQWHEECMGVEDRLRALCFIPSYLSVTGDIIGDVDVRGSLEGLRVVTARSDERYLPKARRNAKRSIVSKLWTVMGGATTMLSNPALLMANTDGAQTDDPQPKLTSSWAGMGIATGFYMHGILRLWGSWQIMERRALRWLVGILQADLEQSRADMQSGRQSRELWFWKLFTVAFAIEWGGKLAIQQGGIIQANPADTAAYQATRRWFAQHIRLWGSVAGVSTWRGAKEALSTIVWPETFPDEEIAQAMWDAAVGVQDDALLSRP